jgi:hypothetical protein
MFSWLTVTQFVGGFQWLEGKGRDARGRDEGRERRAHRLVLLWIGVINPTRISNGTIIPLAPRDQIALVYHLFA